MRKKDRNMMPAGKCRRSAAGVHRRGAAGVPHMYRICAENAASYHSYHSCGAPYTQAHIVRAKCSKIKGLLGMNVKKPQKPQ